jgi:hypothetical protein
MRERERQTIVGLLLAVAGNGGGGRKAADNNSNNKQHHTHSKRKFCHSPQSAPLIFSRDVDRRSAVVSILPLAVIVVDVVASAQHHDDVGDGT